MCACQGEWVCRTSLLRKAARTQLRLDKSRLRLFALEIISLEMLHMATKEMIRES
jgi:hypothetical protein